MDGPILSVGTQEWISNTIVPILTIVIPVWVFLSTKHTSAMKGKVDKETYITELKAVKEDIKEVKHENLLSKRKKVVVTVSSQNGCSMGCVFCDVCVALCVRRDWFVYARLDMCA